MSLKRNTDAPATVLPVEAYVQPLTNDVSGPPPGGGELMGSCWTWTPSVDRTSAAVSTRQASSVNRVPPFPAAGLPDALAPGLWVAAARGRAGASHAATAISSRSPTAINLGMASSVKVPGRAMLADRITAK